MESNLAFPGEGRTPVSLTSFPLCEMNPLAMSVRSAHRRVQGWKVPLGPRFTRGWAEVRIAPLRAFPAAAWLLAAWFCGAVAPPVFLESAAAPGHALMPRGSRHAPSFGKAPILLRGRHLLHTPAPSQPSFTHAHLETGLSNSSRLEAGDRLSSRSCRSPCVTARVALGR